MIRASFDPRGHHSRRQCSIGPISARMNEASSRVHFVGRSQTDDSGGDVASATVGARADCPHFAAAAACASQFTGRAATWTRGGPLLHSSTGSPTPGPAPHARHRAVASAARRVEPATAGDYPGRPDAAAPRGRMKGSSCGIHRRRRIRGRPRRPSSVASLHVASRPRTLRSRSHRLPHSSAAT